jgi:hypothetical protein
MTRRSDYSEEEWRVLGLAVIGAAVAVSKAERSGTAGEFVEQHVTGVGRAELAADLYQNVELIVALAETPEVEFDPVVVPDSDERFREGPAFWNELARNACRDAVAILATKAPEADLDAFRRYVIDLGWRVAYAGRSAAVFGIGRGATSEGELAVLNEIAAALGVDPKTGEPAGAQSS